MAKKNIFVAASLLLVLALIFSCSGDGSKDESLPSSSSEDALLSSSSEEVLLSSSSEEALPSSSSEEALPSSSSEEALPSSSSVEALPSSSSVEALPSSSSIEALPSSSSEETPSSNSVKEISSSSAKENYPMSDGKKVDRGVERYWDGCKPTCSYPENANSSVYAKTCDRNGNEMPLFYLSPADYNPPWHAGFLSTPSACFADNRTTGWPLSTTYAEWKAQNPDFPSGAQAGGYVCSADQIPYAVTENLAYAFAAGGSGDCGKCFMLQFDTENWDYGDIRPNNKALEGKTLIVMINNFGVGEGSFEIMIPGGGVGNFNAVSEQLGIEAEKLGFTSGGLLSECIFNDLTGEYTLEEAQECLRAKCNKTFANHPTHLNGCLWHADWFMAADNPAAFYKEVACPKDLTDRYGSSFPLPSRPETLNPGATCYVDAMNICK